MSHIIDKNEFVELYDGWKYTYRNAILRYLNPISLDKLDDEGFMEQFYDEFEEEQATAPWDVDNFSDELKKDRKTLLWLAIINPFQLKKMDKSLFQDRQFMKEFLTDWFFSRLNYNPSKGLSVVQYLLLTHFLFKIEDEDTWFFQGLLDIKIIESDHLSEETLEKLDLNPLV